MESKFVRDDDEGSISLVEYMIEMRRSTLELESMGETCDGRLDEREQCG